jgi:ATP citrate (pro-S)-lyase
VSPLPPSPALDPFVILHEVADGPSSLSPSLSDAIAAAGFAHELANYGEYSGAPTEGQTYEYAKTILSLITRGDVNKEGKILIIGGGIANFTNVAATFKGIIRALKEYKGPLQQHGVKIFVRRGGPNYQEGLKAMRLLGESLGVEIQVYGPETHITEIVPLALGIAKKTSPTPLPSSLLTKKTASAAGGASGTDTPLATLKESSAQQINPDGSRAAAQDHIVSFDNVGPAGSRPWFKPFDADTRSLVFGLQPRAIQGMLDFDFACGRATPSVAAMIYPFGGHHIQKWVHIL